MRVWRGLNSEIYMTQAAKAKSRRAVQGAVRLSVPAGVSVMAISAVAASFRYWVNTSNAAPTVAPYSAPAVTREEFDRLEKQVINLTKEFGDKWSRTTETLVEIRVAIARIETRLDSLVPSEKKK